MAPHLLTLPGEVKNLIYEFCIDEEVSVEISAPTFLNNIAGWKKKWKITIFEGHPEVPEGQPKQFALTKTCRQIRYEVLPILARLGHSCLYVPMYGPFTAEMVAPLPQPYLGNIRQLRIWKTSPTLKNQTLTSALPALESLILDFHPQYLAKHLGGKDAVRFRDSWSFSYMARHNIFTKLQHIVEDTFDRERAYLAATAGDREIALKMHVPYGSFSVPTGNGPNARRYEADATLVSSAIPVGDTS